MTHALRHDLVATKVTCRLQHRLSCYHAMTGDNAALNNMVAINTAGLRHVGHARKAHYECMQTMLLAGVLLPWNAMQVLSANPVDLAGPLIMARMKPGDPHQLWFQDFWNQFGCSTRQGAVGVLGETCHIKSQAFVLINKATRQLVWAGEEGQPLTLAPYSMGSNAELTRRCTLFDLASTVLQYNVHVNCTAIHCIKPE